MRPEVLIVGGGMITHDQILPSLYHMQRQGRIGEIAICAQRESTVRTLATAPALLEAFPGQSFHAYPAGGGSDPQPDLFREVIARMPPRNIVVIAVPDQLHFDAVMTALRHDQHVLAVKPLTLSHAHTI